MSWYTVKVWDGYRNRSRDMLSTYDCLYNMCSNYPPSYIWTIEPRK